MHALISAVVMNELVSMLLIAIELISISLFARCSMRFSSADVNVRRLTTTIDSDI